MPELPEVETVRSGVHREAVGRRIVEVQATGARTVRRQGTDVVIGGALGREIVGTGRLGKYLWLALGDGGRLVVHLRMSGQLLLCPDPAAGPAPKHTHAVVTFDDGRALRFVDPRTFGEVYVVRQGHEAQDAPELGRMGPDALTGGLRWQDLGRLILARRVPLKGFLVDQRRIAGIGNIYADEICHVAKLGPFRRTDSLTPAELRRLHAAIGTVLSEAIEARGSSLSDEQYVDLYGRPGEYQLRHRVHARAGQACPRCSRPIVRTVFQARGSYSCPSCQR